MRYFTLLLSVLALVMPVRVTCDDWIYRRCFCANPSSFGYVLLGQHSDVDGPFAWMKWVRIPYTNAPAVPPSTMRRCAPDSTTQDCINLPDMAAYPVVLEAANPGNIHEFCETSDTGVEYCALDDNLHVGGRHHYFGRGDLEVKTLMDCKRECQEIWAPKDDRGSNSSTIDLCSYTTSRGERVSTKFKEKKGGKLRDRKEFVECYQKSQMGFDFEDSW